MILNPNFLCVDLNLPHPPEWMSIEALSILKSKEFERKSRERKGGKLIWDCSPAMLEWVKRNVTENFLSCYLAYFVTTKPGLRNTKPHTDGIITNGMIRYATIMWNFDPGGGDPKLTFWREPGEDAIRVPGLTVLENVEKLGEFPGPQGWYLANGRILHNVQDLIGIRVNLQIALTENQLSSLYERGALP